MLPVCDSINRILPDILIAAKDDDRELMETTLDDLDMKVVESYSDVGKEWIDVKRIFKDIRYAMNSYPCNAWRYEKIQNLYKELKENMTSEVLSGDLKDVLSYLHDVILRAYENGFMNKDIDSLMSLKDKMRYLKTLDIRIKNNRPDLYGEYMFTVKEGDRCLALLSKLQPIRSANGSSKSSFKRDSVNDITNQFSSFFSAFSGLIMNFEAPEIVQETNEGECKNKQEEELEEMKEESMRNRIIELLDKNWDFEKISQHMSITKDQIRESLGVEENNA